jgi:mono/diheme cytochrome c family protein
MSARPLWSRQATIGVILIVAGVVIGAVFFSLAATTSSPLRTMTTTPGPVDPVALGKRIFATGTDENGNLIPRSTYAMYGRATCADCHGNDAKGRSISSMMARFDTPDIRWSALSQPLKADDGTTEPAYDATTFERAVTKGVDSAGGDLKPPMPHWELTSTQIDALIAYLKTK